MHRADLHIHTTASDGQTLPEAVVAMALQHQLHTIAITDHDTTEGVRALYDTPLQVIPGIELGSRTGTRKIDILGYFIDTDQPALLAALEHFQQDRYQRGAAIVERLADLNIQINWEQVLQLAGDGAIGRPHIAQVMLQAGYVKSMKEAFTRYLGDNAPAYVPRAAPTPQQAIDMIHQAGGVAVLAHPVFVSQWERTLEDLITLGLDGIETYYPEHTPAFTERVRRAAESHNLIMTGGSDFHGPGVKAMLGDALAPEGCIAALEARSTAIRAANRDNQAALPQQPASD